MPSTRFVDLSGRKGAAHEGAWVWCVGREPFDELLYLCDGDHIDADALDHAFLSAKLILPVCDISV